MQSIALNYVSGFNRWDFENLQFIEIFRNEFINLSIDVYEVGVKTPLMYKNRPDGSCKLIVPFQGILNIITEQQSQIFDPEKEGLQLIIIGQNEKRQFENIGSIQAKVLAIYAPPFHAKEISHIPNTGL